MKTEIYFLALVTSDNLNYKVSWIKTMPNMVEWGFDNSDGQGVISMRSQVFFLIPMRVVWSHGHSFILLLLLLPKVSFGNVKVVSARLADTRIGTWALEITSETKTVI